MNKRLCALLLALLILLGFFISQYYFAWQFSFPPGITRLGKLEIYSPFSWIGYHGSPDPYTAKCWDRAADLLMWYIAGLCIIISTAELLNRKLKNTYSHGAARFITDRELRKLGCFDPHGVCLCQTASAKIRVGEGDKLKLIKPGRQVRYHGDSHVLMVAPTGSGKGVGVVIPTHLNWNESIISIDIKKENYNITSGYRRMFSHVIKFEPTSHDSAHYNFLDAVRIGTPNEVADVQTIVDMIVNDGEGAQGKDPFWDESAKGFLTGLILYMLHSSDIRPEDKNIPYLNRLINDPAEGLMDKLERIRRTDFGDDPIGPVIKSQIVDMINVASSEATFASIVKTVTTKLVLYADPVISKNIASSDFSVMDLRLSEHPVSLYICIAPGDLSRLRPLLRLLLNQFVTLLSQKLPEGKYHKVLFLIDEFTSLRKMEIFEQSAAYMRGYGVKFFFIVQSFTQINEYYGKDNSIIDNCGVQIFYATNRIEVATDLSNRFGNTTVLVDSMSKSSAKSDGGSTSRSTSETAKKILTPEEIMSFPRDSVMLFIEGHSGYLGKKNIYYQDPAYKDRMNLPTPEQLGRSADEYTGIYSNSLMTSGGHRDGGTQPEEDEGEKMSRRRDISEPGEEVLPPEPEEQPSPGETEMKMNAWAMEEAMKEAQIGDYRGISRDSVPEGGEEKMSRRRDISDDIDEEDGSEEDGADGGESGSGPALEREKFTYSAKPAKSGFADHMRRLKSE